MQLQIFRVLKIKHGKLIIEMDQFYRNFIIFFLNVLQISRCRLLFSNNMESYSAEQDSADDGNLVEPLMFNMNSISNPFIDLDDKYGEDDIYMYEDISGNASQEQSEDLRRCRAGSCGRIQVPRRPASKDYPVLVHCRGILGYCRKECMDINLKICVDWPYLCPAKFQKEDLGQRCTVQCIHNYRQMRLKFPNQAKLSKFVDPRYDRFDYE